MTWCAMHRAFLVKACRFVYLCSYIGGYATKKRHAFFGQLLMICSYSIFRITSSYNGFSLAIRSFLSAFLLLILFCFVTSKWGNKRPLYVDRNWVVPNERSINPIFTISHMLRCRYFINPSSLLGDGILELMGWARTSPGLNNICTIIVFMMERQHFDLKIVLIFITSPFREIQLPTLPSRSLWLVFPFYAVKRKNWSYIKFGPFSILIHIKFGHKSRLGFNIYIIFCEESSKNQPVTPSISKSNIRHFIWN